MAEKLRGLYKEEGCSIQVAALDGDLVTTARGRH